MKTFNEFMSTPTVPIGGTYVAARFSDETNRTLAKFAEGIGLEPNYDFHSTIVYSLENLKVPLGEFKVDGSASVIGISYLGDVGSPWRAIVLELESQYLQNRFDFYTENYGYKSTYDKYIQHVSLAYSTSEDIDLTKITIPDFKLIINTEKVETLHV